MLKCNKKQCTGCGMCSNLCPKNAITMITNKEGFAEPKVDSKKCIDCELCNKICPVINKKIISEKPDCYAVQLKNVNFLKKCASGGAFCGIAMTVLSMGGVVYGVSNEVNHLEYIKVDNISKLDKLLSSKYYQCNLNREIVKDIEIESKNKLVLVSGTPCQISALTNNIKINKQNFISLEIICQGVPSQKVINRYHEEIEKKEHKKIIEHSFRSKDYNVGRNYLNKYVFDDGTVKYMKGEEDPLSLTFQRQMFLRNSCYMCKYTNKNRVADFTAGDLWNYDNSDNMNKELGLSVLLCNSNKAKHLILNQENLFYEKINIDEALSHNLPFNRSVNKPVGRYISYFLLNIGLKPSFITKILCWKYYIKQLLKK